MNAPQGYESLAKVFELAIWQAAHGKGKERHAGGLPFHEQRMQSISKLTKSPKGLEFQAIKKLTEGMEFTDHERRERELLGAINYIAGIVIFYRNQLEDNAEAANTPNWDAGEKRMEAIGRNGNDGAHYPEIGFIDGHGIIEVGDHLPELGGYLIGFIGGHGVIMSKANWSVARYDVALELASAFNSGNDARCCGFNDWRVPTKDQLNLAWINRDKLAGLGMSNAFYWSSTEHSPDMAWLQHLSSGNQMKDFKGGSFSVRLVRSVPMDDLITSKEDGAAAEANDGERHQKITTTCPSWITT